MTSGPAPAASGSPAPVTSISRHTVSMSTPTCAIGARPESQAIRVECQVCS
ncbi:hypothetical protein [Streptomyces sp. M92]|uniref:hypothetical protein n=1 Tax=Streptomyces sp. M92 TaxID=2944250 RepID=UPI003FA7D2FB